MCIRDRCLDHGAPRNCATQQKHGRCGQKTGIPETSPNRPWTFCWLTIPALIATLVVGSRPVRRAHWHERRCRGLGDGAASTGPYCLNLQYSEARPERAPALRNLMSWTVCAKPRHLRPSVWKGGPSDRCLVRG